MTTNGQQLSVACGDGHVVTVRKLDDQRLSIQVERVEGGLLKGGWSEWLRGWLLWLLCVYLSIVITLALMDAMGHTPALKEVWADISGDSQFKRAWADVIGQTPLKRVWTKMTGVLEQPVLKKALANLSQVFKK